MLDRQLVFDTVTSHLLRQGKTAIAESDDGEPICAYRDPVDGAKCAIGCLIPDSRYRKSLEGKTVYSDHDGVIKALDPRYGRADRSVFDVAFLCRLQSIHDDLYDDALFTRSVIEPLSVFAKDYNLNPFVLVNCVRALPQGVAR